MGKYMGRTKFPTGMFKRRAFLRKVEKALDNGVELAPPAPAYKVGGIRLRARSALNRQISLSTALARKSTPRVHLLSCPGYRLKAKMKGLRSAKGQRALRG